MNKTVPQKIKWMGTTYHFSCNKGKTILYIDNPVDIWDDSNGEALVIEYRPEMSPGNRFYVLYHLKTLFTSHDGIKIEAQDISEDTPRMAIPIWE